MGPEGLEPKNVTPCNSNPLQKTPDFQNKIDVKSDAYKQVSPQVRRILDLVGKLTPAERAELEKYFP